MPSRLANIALLITELERGGAERVVAYLASMLDTAEFHVEVVSMLPGGIVGEEIAASGIPVVHLGINQVYDIKGWAKLSAYLRAHDIHVLHSHLPAAGLLARIVARAHPQVRTVYTEHNLMSAYRKTARCLDCATLRLPDYLVAVSETVKNDWLRHKCRPSDFTLSVIPNGVDIPGEDGLAVRADVRRELGTAPGELVIGTVGNLFERKGQHYLIEACAALRTTGRFQLVVVGHGPELAPLRRLADRLGLADRTTFLGPRADVPRLLAGFDIFALPSLVEGLPIALLEAMAAGLPCVASAVGGVRDVLIQDCTGLLVPPRNVASLTRELDMLLTSESLRTELGHRARDQVKNSYSAKTMTDRYAALYRSVLAGSPRPV